MYLNSETPACVADCIFSSFFCYYCYY